MTGRKLPELVVVAPMRRDGRERQPADAVHLAAAERDLHVGGPFVAGHDPVLRAEQVLHRQRELAECSGLRGSAEDRLLDQEIVELADPGRLGDAAGAGALVHVADPGELRRLVSRRRIAEDRLGDRRRRERRHHRAVAWRDVVEPVRCDHAGGADHVLHHHRWLARDVAAEMARQHAAVDVVAAADLVPDHERNRLAFVEVGNRIGRGRRGTKNYATPKLTTRQAATANGKVCLRIIALPNARAGRNRSNYKANATAQVAQIATGPGSSQRARGVLARKSVADGIDPCAIGLGRTGAGSAGSRFASFGSHATRLPATKVPLSLLN